jgi:hypothetical protein
MSAVMNAALSAQGCTLLQYQTIMSALCRSGKITQDGECYHLTSPGACVTVGM